MMERKIMLGGNLFFYAIKKKELTELLDFSLDKKINSIDTADIYSEGKSEKMIGDIITKQKRKKWFIATKLGQTDSDQRSHQNTKFQIVNKVNKSLKRLNTDYIDLYQLHHYDPKTEPEVIIETLNSLKREGKIINYGVSNYNLKNLKNILSSKKSKVFSNQIHSNILKLNINKFEFLKNKIKFITYGTLGRGLITSRYLNNDYKSYRYKRSVSIKKDLNYKLIKKLNLIDNFCKNYNGWNIEKIALYSMLNHSSIFKVILGVRSIEQLKSLILTKKTRLLKKDYIYLEKILIKSGKISSKLGEV